MREPGNVNVTLSSDLGLRESGERQQCVLVVEDEWRETLCHREQRRFRRAHIRGRAKGCYEKYSAGYRSLPDRALGSPVT
jgi:hypothetical protein